MTPRSCMVVAGDPSGDQLASELIRALRQGIGGGGIAFFGAGGPAMAGEGVRLELDLTRHSVIGLWEALRHLLHFRRIFRQLLALALDRRPDLLVCVDFSGFNRRFAAALRRDAPDGWRPRIVQLVSPQVWASRPGRARTLERDLDLLLSILPFEKDWYARHTPRLNVAWVGHPALDRHPDRGSIPPAPGRPPRLLLLPGSRQGELARHLPVMIKAAELIRKTTPIETRMVLPESLQLPTDPQDRIRSAGVDVQRGNLAQALRESTLAMASTGTVTLECALYGVPTLALYKTSWSTYQIGKRIIHVPYLAMPNLLAGREVMPEFIQNKATPDALATAAIQWLQHPAQLESVRRELGKVVDQLGTPGAMQRAASEVLSLFRT